MIVPNRHDCVYLDNGRCGRCGKTALDGCFTQAEPPPRTLVTLDYPSSFTAAEVAEMGEYRRKVREKVREALAVPARFLTRGMF